ncbi:hypothetical protein OE88DRAFT_1217931 [Heliocybe sulcata]|uniref:Uncharacterized protein n=1 Tax=Heliocybe sulcata TaxID=5364 RepID=A0A5C3MJ44_9AGAM|nr:hypothetical protein OE88DRAFT_1217931 [Heliocybe sulcata]
MYVEVPPKISPTCLQPPTLFRAQIPESSASRPRASSQASSSTLLSSPDAAPSDPSASDSVLAFLSSLSPPQPHLWPVFNRLGISNAECLRALAARPESRVDAFFQKLVQKGEFSVFQVDAIQWGLKDMADRAEYA